MRASLLVAAGAFVAAAFFFRAVATTVFAAFALAFTLHDLAPLNKVTTVVHIGPL